MCVKFLTGFNEKMIDPVRSFEQKNLPIFLRKHSRGILKILCINKQHQKR